MAKDKDKKFSTAELSKELKISRQFLRVIFHLLNKNGIVVSSKGKTGGFKLALPANKIFVTDLIAIFQRPIKLNDCFVGTNLCPDVRRCVLRKKVQKLEDVFKREFKSLTIASLLKGE